MNQSKCGTTIKLQLATLPPNLSVFISQLALWTGHIKDFGHRVECHDVIILDMEDQWHTGHKTYVEQEGGLRFSFLHTWDWALNGVSSRLSHDQSKGPIA